MSTVKLISQDENTKGKTITLPLVGNQTFDSEDNSITLEESKADELLALDFGIKLLKEEDKKKSQKISDPDKDPNRAMLNGLGDDELDGLLAPYSSKIIKNLKTRQEKIDYLANEMAK